MFEINIKKMESTFKCGDIVKFIMLNYVKGHKCPILVVQFLKLQYSKEAWYLSLEDFSLYIFRILKYTYDQV